MIAPRPPRVARAWYVLAWSHEVGRAPIQRTLYGDPIVLFRGASGEVGALLDRCPHRSVPLSKGTVQGDTLQCAYHGWRFTPDGRCAAIPSFLGDPEKAGRRAPRFAVREQQGVIWVWATPDETPTAEPFDFAYVDRAGYTIVREDVRARASVHAVAENALDVPHTAFLHGGLFRRADVRNRITAEVRRWHDRAECEYIGEPRPTGLVARILSPSGGVVTHFDRFFLPSVVQVEYRIGEENHFVITAACTPADDYDTRLYAVAALRSRIPAFVLKALKPLGLRIFGQDAEILTLQTDAIARFGDEAYASTEIDLLGPHILKLLKRAEREDLGDPKAEPWSRTVALDV